jgi:hypothetical protein
MSKTRALAHRISRLPNSWLFGVLWIAALLTMAVGAARADERVTAVLDVIASLRFLPG